MVHWLGAVQSQDYAGAKWALAQRAAGLVDADLDRAFDEGQILRTHVLRPTWHFVTPADIRAWLLVTGPRVERLNGLYYRKAGLDATVLSRCRRVLERELRDGRHRTRAELAGRLARLGLTLDGQGLAYVVMHAELTGLVCSGPRRGKQFTYALLDERAPAPVPSRDAALAALTSRYFTGHGPATLNDFSWWSGLTMGEAREGVAMMGAGVERERVGERECLSLPAPAVRRGPSPAVYLLPNYDEALIAYRDRGGASAGRGTVAPTNTVRPAYPHQLVIDGVLAGGWGRTERATRVDVRVRVTRALSGPERAALDKAVSRYGVFLGKPATLEVVSTDPSSVRGARGFARPAR